MKKILLLMAILMSFTFISCGDDKEKDEPVEEPVNLEELVVGEWTTENGVNGRRFTGPNGASIFLPAAGRRWEDDLYYAGSGGYYWSSTLYESKTSKAWYLDFLSGSVYSDYYFGRYYGLSVRPVRKN